MASDNVKWFVLLAIVLSFLSYTPTSVEGSIFNQPIILIFAALAVLFYMSTK